MTNTGHGHVRPRADGAKARCGGPAICAKCARELAEQVSHQTEKSDPGVVGLTHGANDE